MLHVLRIEFELLFARQVSSSGNLSQAGQAGSDEKSSALPLIPLCDLREVKRPWADEAHVAYYYIKQLRPFVKGVFPKDSPEPGQARIITRFGAGPKRVNAEPHCSEFVERKRLALLAGALLSEDCRAFAGQTNRQREDGKNR